MPSDVPKEDRCGAKVVSKVGLEVHDSVLDEVFVDTNRREEDYPTPSSVVGEGDNYDIGKAEYDHFMVKVVLSDGEHEQEVDPTWDDVLPLLRGDWHTEAVIVEEETEDAIEHVRVEIPDDDPYVTNRGTVLDGYCLRWPMDNGRCYVHQGPAKKGNMQTISHGLYTTRSRFMEWLDKEGRDDDLAFIHQMVDSWIEDAPFERDNFAKVNELYRLAVDQLRLWYAQDEYVMKGDGPDNPEGDYSGLAYERIVGFDPESGDPQRVFDESPLNLPYSRLERDVAQKLTKMGIYDSPEKQGAEATKSLAQALSEE